MAYESSDNRPIQLDTPDIKYGRAVLQDEIARNTPFGRMVRDKFNYLGLVIAAMGGSAAIITMLGFVEVP